MSKADRLKALAEAAGHKEIAAFARAAGFEPDRTRKQIERNSIPPAAAERYIEAAKGTGADIEWLLTGRGNAPMHVSALGPSKSSVKTSQTVIHTMDTSPLVSVRLWTVVWGETVSIAESNEIVPAPAEFRHSISAFAVQAWDDLNAPWCRRGSLIFVDRLRIPADGHWCLIAGAASSDGRSLYRPAVGVLESIKDGCWMLRLTAGVVAYAVSEWPLAYLVTYIRPT